MGEDIGSPHLVVQQIEAVFRLRLRLAIKLSLERPDFLRVFAGSSPIALPSVPLKAHQK
jgi:hypothetical protein